ncbi:MAG TPA: Fic family protein [Duganella sp.]
MRNDFSDKPAEARLQQIALAHIGAEKELEGRVKNGSALKSAFLIEAHRALYARLGPEDRRSDEGDVIVPGEIRHRDVRVGWHVAPTAASMPAFLQRLDAVYGLSQGWERVLINTACAHHRVAWVHPFLDGNGRAASCKRIVRSGNYPKDYGRPVGVLPGRLKLIMPRCITRTRQGGARWMGAEI